MSDAVKDARAGQGRRDPRRAGGARADGRPPRRDARRTSAIDSLGLVETVFAIEEAFDIQVPFNANEPMKSEFDITSVDTMVRAVENLIAAQK